MKRRLLRLLPIIMALALSAVLFAACNPTSTQYSVTYVAGEGIGDPIAGEPHQKGDTFTLKENTFTNGNKKFTGWNDGEKTYDAGKEYTMPGRHVTFTAQWSDESVTPAVKYRVKFTSGVSSGVEGEAPQDMEAAVGETITLPACPFTRNNYKFMGWKIVGSDEEPRLASTSFIMPEHDVTFEAVWKITYEVAFSVGDAIGSYGTPPETKRYAEGEVVVMPECKVVRSGYTFKGWKTDSDDTLYKPLQNYIMGNSSVLFTAQWDLDVRVEGYWKNGKVPSESVSYDVMVKEGDRGVYIMVIKTVTGSNTSTMYLPRFLVSSADKEYEYSFKNGADTITMNIDAKETSNGVNYSLTLTDGKKVMTSNTLEDFDADTQLQMPQGTYSYRKYDKNNKLDSKVYTVNFGDEPAFSIDSITGKYDQNAQEGQQYSDVKFNTIDYEDVRFVIFNNCIALFANHDNSRDVCQLLFEKNGLSYKAIDGNFTEVKNQNFTAGVKEIPDPNKALPQGNEKATLSGVWTFGEEEDEEEEKFTLTIKELDEDDKIAVSKKTGDSLNWKVICTFNGESYESQIFSDENSVADQCIVTFDDEGKYLSYQKKGAKPGEYEEYTTIAWTELPSDATPNTNVAGRWLSNDDSTLKAQISVVGNGNLKFAYRNEKNMDAKTVYFTPKGNEYISVGEQNSLKLVYKDDVITISSVNGNTSEKTGVLDCWSNITDTVNYTSVSFDGKKEGSDQTEYTITIGNLIMKDEQGSESGTVYYVSNINKGTKVGVVDGLFYKSANSGETDIYYGYNVLNGGAECKLTYSGMPESEAILEVNYNNDSSKVTYKYTIPKLELFGTWVGMNIPGTVEGRVIISEKTNGEISVDLAGGLGGDGDEPIILTKKSDGVYEGDAMVGSRSYPYKLSFKLTFINNVVRLESYTASGGKDWMYYSALCYEKDDGAQDPGTAIPDLVGIWKTTDNATGDDPQYHIEIESATTTIISAKLKVIKKDSDQDVTVSYTLNYNSSTSSYEYVENGTNKVSLKVEDNNSKLTMTYNSKTYVFTKDTVSQGPLQ